MKKAFFIISLLLTCLVASAQEDVKVRFGVSAGFNMTKWGGDFDSKFSTGFKPGFHAGGLAELQIGDYWSVQPELQIAAEGTNTDLIDKIGAVYIKVPVTVFYSIRNVGPGRLSPGLGIYVSGGVGGKTQDVGTFADDSYFRAMNALAPEEFSEDLIPDQFDYGVAFKISYEVQHEKVSGLCGTLGVSYGLTECKSLGLLFSVGYKFPYSKWLRSTYNTGIFEYNP